MFDSHWYKVYESPVYAFGKVSLNAYIRCKTQYVEKPTCKSLSLVCCVMNEKHSVNAFRSFAFILMCTWIIGVYWPYVLNLAGSFSKAKWHRIQTTYIHKHKSEQKLVRCENEHKRRRYKEVTITSKLAGILCIVFCSSSGDEQSILFDTSRPQRLFSEPTLLTWLYPQVYW